MSINFYKESEDTVNKIFNCAKLMILAIKDTSEHFIKSDPTGGGLPMMFRLLDCLSHEVLNLPNIYPVTDMSKHLLDELIELQAQFSALHQFLKEDFEDKKKLYQQQKNNDKEGALH
jgi:uncharacterized protein YecA (UPF0149 family)